MFLRQVFLSSFVVSVTLCHSVRVKRGILEGSFGFGGYQSIEGLGGHNGLGAAQVFPSAQVAFVKPVYVHRISPAEIAAAIQAAKEASSSVMEAQHRVQQAKEDVLHQQHVASQKQAQAALALQKTEAAAAVQQQEAKSAATALVQAQQRLAQAKAEVAEQQRIASAKESHAAAVIQKSAHAAAVDIQKTDDIARKISQIQSSGSSALRQAAASKQGSLTATSAAVAAAAEHGTGNSYEVSPNGPWFGKNVVHLQPWG